MNRVNPKANTDLWDFIRACATGFVTNGHVVLLILVCFGVFFMARGLFGLAEKIDEPDTQPPVEEPTAIAELNFSQDHADAVLLESDSRIDMHRLCTYTEYRAANTDACEAADRFVANAMKNQLSH